MSVFLVFLYVTAISLSMAMASPVKDILRTNCSENEFACNGTGACFSLDRKCDGISDCGDDSDEAECHSNKRQIREVEDTISFIEKQCKKYGLNCDEELHLDQTLFRCKSNERVFNLAVCNGQNDCKDGSDESPELCFNRTSTTSTTTESVTICKMPSHPANGKYSLVGVDANPGDAFDTFVLNITCDVGYAPDITSGVYCVAGQWYSDIPKCVRSCRLNRHPSIEYRCGTLDDKNILQGLKECDTYVSNGTIAKPECRKPNYYYSGFFQNMHCYEGSWDYVPVCRPECGTITPHAEELIAGGRQAARGEIPWHVAVYHKKETPYDQICGGSIVSNTVVITAAHCVWESGVRSASDYAVAAGKLYRAWDHPKDREAQKSDVKQIIVPTHYRGATTNQQDDIALFIVQIPFVYRTFVRPVCLSFDINFDLRQLVDGNKGKVAGWGLVTEDGSSSPTLKTVDLPYVNINDCIKQSPASFHGYITSDKICAGFGNGTALCKGDSGGGLAFPEYSQGAERYYLRGIVSTAPTNDHLCNTNTLTAFTRVIAHEHFIKEFV